jgi:hypothetical protein
MLEAYTISTAAASSQRYIMLCAHPEEILDLMQSCTRLGVV